MFSRAMAAGHSFDKPGEAKRSALTDPGHSTWDRSSRRLDAVDILLERRRFRADRLFDMIIAITAFTDSSPTTSEEFQGMLLDIARKDGDHRRITLPGATLFYGNYGALAKTMALLWACWLVAGPTLADMQYFLDKMTCITTDGGTDIKTLEVPNILHAFMAWVGGADLGNVAHLVRHNERLFGNALRVIGWSHAWANSMKTVARSYSKWPEFEEMIGNLVSFFFRIRIGENS
jgi:hypothetical protein